MLFLYTGIILHIFILLGTMPEESDSEARKKLFEKGGRGGGGGRPPGAVGCCSIPGKKFRGCSTPWNFS